MLRRVVDRVAASEILLVCRFELWRTWGKGGEPRFFRHVLLLAAAILLAVLSADRWLTPLTAYTVAIYAQPAGLILQWPSVPTFWELPLWSMSPAHLALAAADLLLLTWARVYVAVGAAAAVYRDRESVQEEMLALSRLGRVPILLGKVLAPVLPVAAAGALVIGVLAVRLVSSGAPLWVPFRAWLELVLHSAAISAVCLGAGSRFRRRGLVLLASCAASVLGISVALWGYGTLVLWLRRPEWVRDWTASSLFNGIPPADPALSWMVLLCFGVVGLALADIAAGAHRSRRRVFPRALGSAALLAGAIWAGASRPLPAPSAEAALPQGEAPALDAARDALARHQPGFALRSLEDARRAGLDNQQARILRVCALFDAGRYREARLECARLQPFRISFFRSGSYWVGMTLCSLADGRERAARDYLRALVEGQSPDAPELRDDRSMVLKATSELLAMEPEYRLPIRGVALRWAVQRFPDDRRLRACLQDELRNWAGRSSSPSARLALLNEANRTVAKR